MSNAVIVYRKTTGAHTARSVNCRIKPTVQADFYSRISAMVMLIYILYSCRDWSENLAKILSFVGPVVSELAISCPLIPKTGKRAVINTIMPIPPSQWVNERQKRIERGSTSTSVNIEEPVVVNPETLSKKHPQKNS